MGDGSKFLFRYMCRSGSLLSGPELLKSIDQVGVDMDMPSQTMDKVSWVDTPRFRGMSR